VGTRYETFNGQPFFRGQVSDSDGGISCIFASDAQLDLLSNSQELHVDATYKTVPHQFYQLFTIGPFVSRQEYTFLVRERSALADPYCHSAWNSVCVYVRDFEVKYLKNQRS